MARSKKPGSKKAEWTNRAGGTGGGVVYLAYILKGMPENKYKELLIFLSPVITIISSNLTRFFRKSVPDVADYAADSVRECIRRRKRNKMERRFERSLKDPNTPKEVREDIEIWIRQLHTVEAEHDFKKLEEWD
jgi:hypothetical protein